MRLLALLLLHYPFSQSRDQHAAVVTQNDAIVIVGGRGSGGSGEIVESK